MDLNYYSQFNTQIEITVHIKQVMEYVNIIW